MPHSQRSSNYLSFNFFLQKIHASYGQAEYPSVFLPLYSVVSQTQSPNFFQVLNHTFQIRDFFFLTITACPWHSLELPTWKHGLNVNAQIQTGSTAICYGVRILSLLYLMTSSLSPKEIRIVNFFFTDGKRGVPTSKLSNVRSDNQKTAANTRDLVIKVEAKTPQTHIKHVRA